MLKCTEWTKSKHVNIGDQQNRTKLRLLAHSLKKKKSYLCCVAMQEMMRTFGLGDFFPPR